MVRDRLRPRRAPNLAGGAGSGMSAGEADAEAVKAVSLLRRAAAMGFRDPPATAPRPRWTRSATGRTSGS